MAVKGKEKEGREMMHVKGVSKGNGERGGEREEEKSMCRGEFVGKSRKT